MRSCAPRRHGGALARLVAVLLAVLTALSLAGPSTSATVAVAGGSASAPAVQPLPVGTDFDYQLGGNRPVPDRVGIVVRDRKAAPLAGRYDVCYVNGFQTQPDERRFWKAHPRLVLRRDGAPVTDSAWGEWLLDIGTAAKRTRLAAIVGRWTDGCAADGYAAVELDNLDSFTRSHHLLTRGDAVAFARRLVARAHAAGLAVGQKNLAGFDGTRVGYDFAIAEECSRYDECGDYVDHYGSAVLAVEYRRADFTAACRQYGDTFAIVLRDRELTPRGTRAWCPRPVQ